MSPDPRHAAQPLPAPLVGKRVVFPAPRPGTTRLYVVFNVPRASVLKPGHPVLQPGPAGDVRAALDPLPRGYTWANELVAFGEAEVENYPNVLVLDVGEDALGREAEYRVLSVGEKPELVRQVLDMGGQRSIVVESTGACYDTADLSSLPVPGPGEAHVFGVEEYLAALRTALDGLEEDEYARYRRFFFELDERTEGHLRTPLAAKEWQLHMATNDVFTGVKLRFDNGYQQAISPVECHHGPLDNFADAVEKVSKLFFELMQKHMPGEVHGIDPEEVERAFELFADGRLRLRVDAPPVNVWTTQPSSGFYFFFAQFALLAAEIGPMAERETWARLARVMVYTHHVFAAAYTPKNAKTNPCDAPDDPQEWKPADYCACNYVDPTHDETALEALREAHADLSVPELGRRAAQNAAEIFPGLREEIAPCNPPGDG